MPRPERRPTAGRRRGIAIVTLALAVGAAAPVLAQSGALSPPAGQARCSFGAFVNETDPEGLNVRAGPSVGHKIVGRLPPVTQSKSDPPIRAMVEVEVTAGSDGWFQIRKARDNEALTEAAARPMFKGSGWVSGRKLTVKSQADTGRERPDAKAPVIIAGRDGMAFDSDAFIHNGRLLGCSGKWVLVEYGPLPAGGDVLEALEVKPPARAGLEEGRFRAWLDRICAVQETSCDGG